MQLRACSESQNGRNAYLLENEVLGSEQVFSSLKLCIIHGFQKVR